ncbi:hypothetical protein GRJ2_001435800 [Grus japonensis]|uniref:Uncharacterized protein n=1 Tax=Grus japonensis TaxID=30415 RepID=A0ABC9WXA7_GRUJA
MSDSGFLLSLSILLLAAGAILLAIGHCQQVRGRLGPGELLGDSTGAPVGPQCCSPSCTHCIKAAQELQQLVLSTWAGTRTSATLDASIWQAAWQDLEELMEWSYLPCCSFCSSPKSLSPSESLRQTCLSQDGGVLMEARPTCSIRPVQVNRAWSALKMHVARKGLEIGLGALPMPVQLSQQQAVQQQGRRVLPKLIQPGQRQPLLRRKLCPSLQVKADTIVENIKEKEVRRLWGDPNPTEESLALLLPCPPPLLAPLDLQVPQEHSVQRPRALAMTPPALPSLDNRTAGPEAGLASILPKECVSHQSFSATRGRHQTDIEDSSRPRAAAAVTISKMELSQEVRSTLWMHTARKHLEIKLQRLPMVVQQSTEMLHRSLPKLRRAGSLGPCSASLPLLKLKHLIQPHQDTLRQLGTSLACPVASVTPRACPVPVPVYSPVPRQNNSQASLQASTLPSMSCSCGDAMGTATMGAVLRTAGGMANASAGQASTRSVLFPGFPAMGSKPEPWRGAHLWARCGGFVAPAPGVPQSHRGCCKAEDTTAGGSFHRLTDAVPSVGTTSTQGTPASKPAWQDLEELMEWSYLPCCSFCSSPKSLSPSESLRQTCLSQDGGVLMEARPTCSIRPVQVNRAWSALKMHVARKGLEIGLGALPMPVQLSQQQAVQQQGRRVLPKLIQPGQRQPLLRRKLCPSLQVKADTIVENIKEKEVRRLWGDPNPTEESLALLLPCPPPLLAPLDLQVPQEHSVQRPRALAMTPPALPSLDNRTAGPEAGLASILPKECVSHQSFSATRGRHQTDIEDSSRPRAAAAVTISKMELSQEVRSTLWMHTARKHLEIKLQRLPMVVQQSTEMLHRSLPKLRRAGSLGPCSASLPLLKLKHLIQPHQDTLRQLGTSLACPVASVTPRACPVPVPVYSPVPRQNNSQASLQASTLPSMTSATLDASIWQAAWQDLEELMEWSYLPCCSFCSSPKSLSPSESLRQTCLSQDGGVLMEARPTCSIRPVQVNRAWSALKMHVARKGLEIGLGALPMPVQLSQQQAVQQQGRRVLPKLIQPGQRQPLLRRKLCPSLQVKADTIVENIKEKEVRRLWGDPNPTEESLALLLPCPPPLLAPLDLQVPQEHSVQRPRALAMTPPALPSLDNRTAGPEAGPASILPKECVSHQSFSATRGRHQTDIEDSSRPRAAAACLRDSSAQELQQLVLSTWAGTRTSATLDASIWQAAWQDLEELMEWSYLPCCSFCSSPKSLSPSESLRQTCLSQDGGVLMEARPTCSIRPVQVNRAWSALKMHVARKGLEIGLGALPMPVQLSQQQAVQQQGRRVLPKLIQPGQRQPLLRRKLCPSLQVKADTIVENIKEKEVRRLWGDPNPTEESLALLLPCPPPLLAPLDLQVPQEHSVQRPRALAMTPPALPSLDNRTAGPEAGPASILPKECVSHQSFSATRGRHQTDIEDSSRPRAAAAVTISKMELSQEVRSTLWMHTARKHLEIKLQRLPMVVQQSTEMLHRSLPKLRRAGSLGPCSASLPLLKLKHLIQPHQDTLRQLGTSLACPVASVTPRACPVPVPVYSPVPRQNNSQASLQASTLPSMSCGCGDAMGTATMGAVLRTAGGMANASAGQASTRSVLFPGFPAMGSKPEPWRGAHLWARCGGFVAPAPGVPQSHRGCCKAEDTTAGGSFHRLTDAVPSVGTTSTQGTAASKPGAPVGPQCCSPSCTHCIKAAQELQQLVLSTWAGTRTSATLDASIWQAAWQDLEELMEWSYLPCCSFCSSPKSLSPSESLRQTCLSQDGGVLMEARPTCSIRPVQVNRAWSALKMHVARKGLEIGLGALPMPVQLSQQQAVQQQGRRVLPKLIQPGQRQPLLRRKLCPSLQVKADTIVENIKEKEVRRLWGDPNPTEESLALLLPCPPPLLAPLDLQVPQEHSVQRPRALAMTPPALPSLDNRTAGPEAGPASILPKECVSHQSFSATRGRHQTDIEDSSRPRAAAAVTISKMELSQEVRSTLWMHTARKHLEIKLQRLPMVVQQSTEMLHRSLPKLRRAGSLGPCSASLPLLKLKHLIQPHQDTLRQLGTSLACPVASVTPRACPVPVPVYSPVPRQNNSQASLQASTLPSMSCSCGDAMGTATMGAVLRTAGGMANASAGQASTRSVLFPGFPAMGSKPEPWRGAHLWARCGGFVAPAPGVPQSHRGCCKAEDTTAGGSFHRLTDAVPSVGTTSTQGTPASKPGSGKKEQPEEFCRTGALGQL